MTKYCSFCDESQNHVKVLVESNVQEAWICESCIAVAAGVVVDNTSLVLSFKDKDIGEKVDE